MFCIITYSSSRFLNALFPRKNNHAPLCCFDAWVFILHCPVSAVVSSPPRVFRMTRKKTGWTLVYFYRKQAHSFSVNVYQARKNWVQVVCVGGEGLKQRRECSTMHSYAGSRVGPSNRDKRMRTLPCSATGVLGEVALRFGFPVLGFWEHARGLLAHTKTKHISEKWRASSRGEADILLKFVLYMFSCFTLWPISLYALWKMQTKNKTKETELHEISSRIKLPNVPQTSVDPQWSTNLND